MLADAIAVPAAAQLVCAPVIVVLAGTVSLVAIPRQPARRAGRCARDGPRSPHRPGRRWSRPSLAALLAQLAGIPVGWIVAVAHTGGGRAVCCRRLAARLARARLSSRSSRSSGASSYRGLLRRPPAAAAAMACALRARLAVGPATRRGLPRGWLMVACDVGQGDSLVVATAPHHAVLVDAGPDPRAVDSCLRRLGVRHSRPRRAHPLPRRPRRGPPRRPRPSPRRAPSSSHRWRSRPTKCGSGADGGRRRQASRCESSRWGSSEQVGTVSLTRGLAGRLIRGEGSDPNNASIVLLVATTSGVRLLLTGDVEAPAQGALLDEARADGVDLHADVLKVPHHGSANQDPDLVDRRGAALRGGVRRRGEPVRPPGAADPCAARHGRCRDRRGPTTTATSRWSGRPRTSAWSSGGDCIRVNRSRWVVVRRGPIVGCRSARAIAYAR